MVKLQAIKTSWNNSKVVGMGIMPDLSSQPDTDGSRLQPAYLLLATEKVSRCPALSECMYDNHCCFDMVIVLAAGTAAQGTLQTYCLLLLKRGRVSCSGHGMTMRLNMRSDQVLET